MYTIDDLIIYSTHGICKIINISEKTFGETTKNYYELQPLKDKRLTINIPVNSDKIHFLDLVNKEEAQNLLDAFKQFKEVTIDKNFQQTEAFINLINLGKRHEIVDITQTLMRKQDSLKIEQKKLPIQEVKLLQFVQSLLINELALSLEKSYDDVYEQITTNMHNSVE